MKSLERLLEDWYESYQDLLQSYRCQADKVCGLENQITELKATLETLRYCQGRPLDSILLLNSSYYHEDFPTTDMSLDLAYCCFDNNSRASKLVASDWL